jgi:hypothetical protein
MLFDNNEQLMLMITAKELEDNKKKKQPRSMIGRLCIPRNCTLGHSMLMQDYYSEVPTYLTYLFNHRYRIWCSLFVKIVETCIAKTLYFKHRSNTAGLLGFSGYKKYPRQ